MKAWFADRMVRLAAWPINNAYMNYHYQHPYKEKLTERDLEIIIEALQVAMIDAQTWGEFGGNEKHIGEYRALIARLSLLPGERVACEDW